MTVAGEPNPVATIAHTVHRAVARPCGRCVCEEELCTELLARLAVFPKMKSTLESLGLPPKLLSLTTGNKTEEVELQLESTELLLPASIEFTVVRPRPTVGTRACLDAGRGAAAAP